jgi:hypothetical protein
MKKTRIIQRTVSTFLAAAMLATLASCNTRLPGTKNSDGLTNQPHQIMNYYTTEMLALPGDFGNANNIFCNDENIFIYGNKSNETAEILSGIYDFGTKELKDLDLSELNANAINTVAVSGKDLAISYMEGEEYTPKFAVFDTASSKVKCSTEISRNAHVSAVAPNAAGDLVAVLEEWGPASSKHYVKTYDAATLEEKSSIDITESLGSGNDSYLSGIVFDEAGDLYTLLMDYSNSNGDDPFCKLIKFKADGSVIYTNDELTDINGGGMVIKRKNGNICVMSSPDGHSFAFDEIDNVNGDVLKRYDAKLDGELSGVCLSGGGDADFVFSDDKGIWKLNIETEKPEKILSFGTDLPESYSNIYQMAFVDGKLFLYGQDWGENSSLIYKFDKDGNFTESIPLKDTGKNGYIMSISADADGKIMAVSQEYNVTEDGSEYVTCYVYEIKEDGSSGDKITLKIDSDDQYYIERVEKTVNGDYAAIVHTYGGSESGSFVQIFNAEETSKAVITDKEIEYVSDYFSTPSGDYISYRDKSGNTVYRKVDSASYGLGEEVELNIPADITRMESDGNYDICYSNASGIYGYSFAENKSTEIVNWIDSDIVFSVWSAAFFGSDRIVCQGYDYTSGEQQVYVLKRADDETLKKIQNKKLVTIAGVGIENNTAFREKVVDFNRNSNEYRLQVNDYQKFSKYEDNTYNSGAFQLNNDMAAGNVPDILVGSEEVSMTSFAAKNILADLSSYLDNDSDIKKEDFFENIFDLGTYKGKICQVFAGYSIRGLAGPESKLGKEQSLKHADLMALKKKGPVFYEDMTRISIRDSLIKDNLAEYVDFENKTCDFDNERFSGIIDLVTDEGTDKTEEELYKEYKEDSEISKASRYNDKKCQLDFLDLYNFSPILELQQGALGEAAVIKGYPSENGSGIIVSPDLTLAICEKSKNKDAAWDFIKDFLTKEYQDEMNESYISCLPVRKDSFDALLERSKNPDEYQYYSVVTADGAYNEMKPLDDTTAEKIRKAVESADRCELSDERIEKIIDEAVDQVWNGEKTSAEAASDIQKKVSTYLNEIK